MPRFDDIGLFWEDHPQTRKKGGGERVLGPMPPIPETSWKPVSVGDLPDIRDAKTISLDTETFDPELSVNGPGWARNAGHMCGVSVAVEGRQWYVPTRHTVQSELNHDPEVVTRWLNHIFSNENNTKVGANILYDLGWLKHEGVTVKGKIYDVQYAEALLKEDSKVALDKLGEKYCGEGKTVDLLKEWILSYYGGSHTSQKWRGNIYRAPVTLTGHYAEQDAVLPLKILQQQWPLLDQQGLLPLFEMECSLINLLLEMRQEGVSVDVPYAERLDAEFAAEQKKIEDQLRHLVGFEVNVNASASLAKAFDELGLDYPRTKPTKNAPNGNPSFVQEFLSGHQHEVPQLVTAVRELGKLRGTFIQGYLLDSHVNGKVHGSFNSLSTADGGARTGRFSSSNPNLQNIPTRSKQGKMIRRAFIPDPGHDHWRKDDYSQIEYRLLAHFAVGEGSDTIRERYVEDPKTDYHETTANLIEEITGVVLGRGQTKNINFGLAYGMGVPKLAASLNVSISDARGLFKAYHEGVPFVQETIDAMSNRAAKLGYNETILGRRTRFDLWEPNGFTPHPPLPYYKAVQQYGYNIKRAYLYRTLNYTLQGSSADMMKAAMAKCYADGIFDVTGVPRLTVHDELDFSVRDRSPETVEAFKEMKRAMENVIPLRVPVVCDVEEGPTWGDVEEIAA